MSAPENVDTRTTRLKSGISLKSDKAKAIEATNSIMASTAPAAVKSKKSAVKNGRTTKKSTAAAPTKSTKARGKKETPIPDFPNLPNGSIAPAEAPEASESASSGPQAPPKKASAKPKTSSGKATANTSSKRKNLEDDNHEETARVKEEEDSRSSKRAKPNGVPAASRKRRSVEDEGDEGELTETSDEPASKKAKVTKKSVKKPQPRAPVKARPRTQIRPKKVINQAPTQVVDVYVFGEGSSGELGLGTAKSAIDVKRPRLNPLLSAKEVGVTQVACGGMHVAALTKDGNVFTWGVNDQGALGRNTNWEGGMRDVDDDKSDSDDDGSDSGLNPKESVPTAIPSDSFPPGTVIVKVSAGDSHTLALTDDGFVYGWGTFRNNDGIQGFSKTSFVQTTPALLPNLSGICDIASGSNHALALSNKGVVYVWGCGQQSQLGFRVIERKRMDSLDPSPLRLRGKNIRYIACGADHSFAIDGKEQVWAWGLNSFGATGIRKGAGNDNAVTNVPEIVPSLKLENDKITHIDGGRQHTLAVTEQGQCLVWGRFDGSQTGVDVSTVPEADVIRDSRDQARILAAPMPVPGVTPTQFAAAGADHSIAITENGKAFSWGFSANYQTGLGTEDDIAVPTMIANTAIRDRYVNWAGAGGQYSIITSPVVTEQNTESSTVNGGGPSATPGTNGQPAA